MSKTTPAPKKHVYLTIVSYNGGQIDNSLKPTVVLNGDQFVYAYGEEDKGFVFKEYMTEYSTKFNLANIAKTLGLDTNLSLTEIVDALYNLEDHGFEDTDTMLGVHRFVKRVTGEHVAQSNKVDPRGAIFN